MSEAVRAVLGEFVNDAALLRARRSALEAGLHVEQIFSAIPLDIEAEAPSPVRRWVLFGGVLGVLSGLALTIGTALYWPLIVGGMPIVSLPPFLIIAFELCILLGALGGLAGFLVITRLPPRRDFPGYDAAFAGDRYGIVLGCDAPQLGAAKKLLSTSGAAQIRELGGARTPPADGDDSSGGNVSASGKGSSGEGPEPFLLILLVGLMSVGCGLEMPWGTDMAETPAVMADEELRLPVEGTLHRDGEVTVSRFQAARLQNPLPDYPEVLERGARLYEIYCTVCHGADGRADGSVATYFEARPPTDLLSTKVRRQADGYIYATIRLGGGDMPALGAALSPEERWMVVRYVRSLQGQ